MTQTSENPTTSEAQPAEPTDAELWRIAERLRAEALGGYAWPSWPDTLAESHQVARESWLQKARQAWRQGVRE